MYSRNSYGSLLTGSSLGWGTNFLSFHSYLSRRDACIQHLPHGLCEFMRLNRLGEKIDTFLQREILGGNFGTVTAGINHFQSWIFFQKLLAQIFSVDPAGHNQIGQQQEDFIPVFFPDFEGFDAIARFQHPIAELRQRFAHGSIEEQIIFNVFLRTKKTRCDRVICWTELELAL